VCGRTQVLFQRHFKVHQLFTFRISDPGQIEVSPGKRRRDSRHVEEHESALRTVRFHCLGGKLRIRDFVRCILAYTTFFLWPGQRIRRRAARRARDTAVDVVLCGRWDFVAIGGHQLRLHPGQRDGLIAVIGDDNEDGYEIDLTVRDGEDCGLVRHVVWVETDGDSLIGMLVVRGIAFGRLRRRHHKVFAGPAEDRSQNNRSCTHAKNRLGRNKKPLCHDFQIIGCGPAFQRCPKQCDAGKMSLPAMYLIYSALLAAGLLLTLPYWLLQMSRHGKYHTGLKQRLGRVPDRLAHPSRPVIWVHAVSVGEVLAISGLVAELQRQYPEHWVVVSTTTDTGQKLARTRFGAANVLYFPMDFAFAIRPYLQWLHPNLIVIAETEFWPNFLRLAKASEARIAVVNARISNRSWPRYRRLRFLLRHVLKAVDLFLAQTGEDARRLREIGASSERVQVSGNLKFDVPAPPVPPIVNSLRTMLQESSAGPVIVCGSTVDDEEPMLLQAFQNVLASHPAAVMILAPRHPERFAQVAQLLESLGIRFWRRSLWAGNSLAGGALLVDSIGELAALYALADIAFVGGSLVPRGGHNILEAAQHGVAIVVGNYTENFRDIVALFHNRDAVRVVSQAELPLVLLELISNPSERLDLGRRGAETLRLQAGATQRTLAALRDLLPPPRTTSDRGVHASK